MFKYFPLPLKWTEKRTHKRMVFTVKRTEPFQSLIYFILCSKFIDTEHTNKSQWWTPLCYFCFRFRANTDQNDLLDLDDRPIVWGSIWNGSTTECWLRFYLIIRINPFGVDSVERLSHVEFRCGRAITQSSMRSKSNKEWLVVANLLSCNCAKDWKEHKTKGFVVCISADSRRECISGEKSVRQTKPVVENGSQV